VSETEWFRYEEQQPDIGQKVIGLNPVNKGSRSERWEAKAMIRLNIEEAAKHYDDDFDRYEIESWYAPLDEVSSDCSAPWLWTPLNFGWPSELPSEAYPYSGPYR